jgi:hypothetical protein
MLDTAKAMAALEAKKEGFGADEQSRQEVMATLEQALDGLSNLSWQEIEARLARFEHPGAHPTAEHDAFPTPVIPFDQAWDNHRQAREWAFTVLEGVPTFAADGSQIAPSRDLSIPVGVIQVGWFENLHRGDGAYVKDIAMEVLPPDELAGDEGQESGFPDQHLNWRRFQMEVERLMAYMETKANAEPKPLCFFDGSLVVSFVQHMRPDRQRQYVDAVMRLLMASEHTGVPLVGYVDTSYANDLTSMLVNLMRLRVGGRVSDAGLLRPRMQWGDRSQVYVCARDDAVLDKYYERVCFLYLKTTAGNPPARVEFPRWMHETGEHLRALDLVRAECVVGNGYPYALETADAVAVLTMQDRERFYRLFQGFAEREGLPLRFSRKAMSKRGRRA